MKKQKGFFIVLDGIDGAGKATQTKLLLAKLQAAGYSTGTLDFPRYYDHFFGKLAGEYLAGELGDPEPRLASVLYALDRWEAKDLIAREIAAGKVFVCDRYASANMIHQAGRIREAKKRREMMAFLEEMEFGVLGIPRPDLVIYLDVLPEVGQMMVDKKSKRAYARGKQRDLLERDGEHLHKARQQALRLVKSDPTWRKVSCMHRKEMRTPQEVSELVWKEAEAGLERNGISRSGSKARSRTKMSG